MSASDAFQAVLLTLLTVILIGCAPLAIPPQGSPTPNAAAVPPDRMQTTLPDPSQTSTLDVTATDPPPTIEARIQSIGCIPYFNLRYSQDKSWLAVTCWFAGQSEEVVVLGPTGSGLEWHLTYRQEYGPPTLEGHLFPFQWTQDGEYLYLAGMGQADGPGLLFSNGSTLLRLELVTGKLEVIVSPAGTEFYSFAISPDGSIISVIDQFRSPLRLTLLDAFGGGERHVTLPSDFTIAGSQAWSPTSDSIILAAARTGAEWNPPISILYVDTTVGYTQTLVRDHESLLVPVEWLGPDRVLLTDRRASGATKYVMTISTGELTAYD